VAGYTLRRYPIPNAISTFVLGLLDLYFTPITSGRLLLSASLILCVLGAIYLAAWRAPRPARLVVNVLALCYAFNAHIFRGNINYIIGAGVLYLYVGYILRKWPAANTATLVKCSLALSLIFAAHLLPYVLAVAVTFGIALSSDIPTKALKRFCLVVAPTLILFGWYTLARTGPAGDHLLGSGWQGWSLKFLESRFVEAFSLFQLFPPWLNEPAGAFSEFAALDALLIGAGLVILLSPLAILIKLDWSDISAFDRVLLACGGACALVFVFAPVYFGDVWAPGERFLLPGFVLLLGPAIRTYRGSGSYGIFWALCLVVIVQGAYLQTRVSAAALGLERSYRELSATSSRDQFCKAYRADIMQTWPVGRLPLFRRMPYVMPLVSELPYYFYFAGDDCLSAPGFSTGILKYRAGTEFSDKTQIFCTEDGLSAPPFAANSEQAEYIAR
jgi:hypothetical protein